MGEGGVKYKTALSVMWSKEITWGKLEKLPPPKVDLTKQKTISLFDNPPLYAFKQEYDHFFAYTKTFPLYDKRKEKDNRPYLPDIRKRVFEQEKRKPVPVLTSLVYGRPCRVQYDFPSQQYYRQAEIASLYRRSGIMPPIEREVQ